MTASLQILLNLLFMSKLRILECDNTDSNGILLMFWRNLLPPSPGTVLLEQDVIHVITSCKMQPD
jgi:hypothetical protein